MSNKKVKHTAPSPQYGGDAETTAFFGCKHDWHTHKERYGHYGPWTTVYKCSKCGREERDRWQ